MLCVGSARQGETDTALLRSMSRCSDLELQVTHASHELLHVKQQYDMVLPQLSSTVVFLLYIRVMLEFPLL